MRRSTRIETVVAVLLLVASIAVGVKLAIYIDRSIVDDALISIGFARSLADGAGLRPTPHTPVVEGFSNPTWTFLLFIVEKLGKNSMRFAKTGGIVFALLAMPLVSLWGPVSQRRRLQIQDAAAPLFACTNATFIYWALGGLEMGLLLFLIALFGVLLGARRTPWVAIALGLTGAAVCLTRPEGALYVAVLSAFWILDAALDRALFTKANAVALASFFAPVAAYLIFRRIYFAAYLPNTYYAKTAWTIGLTEADKWGVDYDRSFFELTPLLFIASGAGALLSIFGRLRIAKTALGCTALVIAMFYFAWHSHGDWMKEWRFLAPTIPFVGYPIAAAATAFREIFERNFFRRRRPLRVIGRLAVAALVLVGLGYTGKAHAARWKAVKEEGGDVPRNPEDRGTYGTDIRATVAPYKMTHPLVASPDMGWLQLGLPDFELMDTAGLTDVAIARHFNNWNALRDYFTNEGFPTVLLYWGPSTWMEKTPDLLTHFRPGPHGYRIYSGVTPREDDRCPGGKSSVLDRTADALAADLVADLDAKEPVRALARWRCALSYRKDSEMPAGPRRIEIAERAKSLAEQAAHEHQTEPALRNYSACAVIGASSVFPSVSCRAHAEELRAKMFPRPEAATRAPKPKKRR